MNVVRAVESAPIKAIGTSQSVHLIDLSYDGAGVGHAPYNEALVGGIQRRSDGDFELWGKKEGSSSIFVSSPFGTGLIPTGGASKAGIISAGGYVWFDATFSGFTVQSLALYTPALSQIAIINFAGTPLVRSQESLVVLGFLLFSISASKSATELWN